MIKSSAGASGHTGVGVAEYRSERKAPFPRTIRRIVAGVLNPYVQIALGSISVTASELLMKRGAGGMPAGSVGWFGIAALGSLWTWGGIVTYILSFLSWIYVLRVMPLGLAFALINVTHVLIPIGAWLFLGERVSLQRWAGIALVLAGILLLLRTVIHAEEKL